MASASEWREVCEAVREAPQPLLSPHWPKLYAIALEDGRGVLRRKWAYSNDGVDMIHDVLLAEWEAIVRADSPKAFFTTVLVNWAITAHRKTRRATPTADEVLTSRADRPSAGVVVIEGVTLDLGTVLEWLETNLRPRDYRVFLQRTCLELTSAEVAEAENLSVANVDQIVSRARRAVSEAFA